jgi:hypothetical protein
MNDFRRIAGAAAVLALCASSAQAATIQISSRDAPGVGFNDPTVVAPVGGNPGTTLGQQRLNVYKYVAHLWEQALDSDVTITVSAGWQALSCSSSTAVLGSASPWNIWHDFPGSKPGTWYPAALANKLAGENLTDGIADDGSGYGNVDIKTQFNINLGQPGCLDGLPFYLGLDGNSGGLIDFAATLEHELGHGLGFTVLTVDTSTGYRLNAAGNAYLASGGLPSIWEGFMVDNTTGKTWLAMTSAERQASALNSLQLAWNSPAMLTAAKATLSALPVIKVTTPAPSGSGLYAYGTAAFGPTVVSGAAFGALATVPADPVNGAGCVTFSAATAAAVAGKVAIIDRGTCAFALKALNAQNAGAIGVIIANNVGGSPPGLGGSGPTITIPVVSVSQADGVTLKAVVAVASHYGSRTKAGVATSAFTSDASRRAGADALGRPLLYTPVTLAAGSSVSHWDVSAFPNLLMEPNINADLTTSLVPPLDLTKPLLTDLGW